MTPRLLPDPPVRTPGSMPPGRKRSDPLPTRVIAAAAGVAATLGLIVVLAPPEAQVASGSTDTSAPQGSDAPTDSSALTGDVVESPAPSPVKVSRTARATAKPTHAAKPKAAAGTTTAAAPRVTPKPGAAATPAPKPTSGPQATPKPTPKPTPPPPPPTPKPTPKPTPVPTGASGKP